MNKITYSNLCENLVNSDSESTTPYQEYLQDHDNEQLPYVFIGSYWMPWMIKQYQVDTNYRMPSQTAAILEEAYLSEDKNHDGTDTLRNLISASFLEHLKSDVDSTIRDRIAADLLPELQLAVHTLSLK